jgi:hypothetical protein
MKNSREYAQKPPYAAFFLPEIATTTILVLKNIIPIFYHFYCF